MGKSRLALEVARAIEGDFSDGAWFVELAAASRPDQVAGTVASALELTPAAGETVGEALVRFLRPRRALLVLDNFEHVLPAADLVHELLSRCAGLKVLATSRSPLDIRPEHRMTVDPLGLPVGESPGAVRRSPAGALFLDRARSQGAQLSIDAENAGAIAAICRRLDGLPLAIELAAARAPMLAPHELSSRLAGALDSLGSAARDAPARQRTLRATIDWSCRLLEPGEAAAFARFAVFSGGASIASAEEVTGADLDTLEGLAGKHLVIGSGGGRVHMLETVQEYARERLGALPDARDVAARHRDHYVALAERAEPHLYTHGEREWLLRLDADAGNLRAAFDWAVEEDDPRAALRLAGLLHAFWVIRGRVAEGLDAVRRALAAAGDGAPLADRALTQRAYVHLLIANGAHYDWQGARGDAEAQAAAAVDLSRQVGEPGGIADALLLLSSFADTDRAPPRPRQRALAEEALALAREAGDERLTAFALMTRAIALPVADAEAEVEEAAAALRDVGDTRHLMWLYSNTAYNALMEGFVEPARPLLDRALPLARELGYPLDLALACGNAGLEALFSGDLERAQQAFDEMLRISWDQVGWLAAEGLVGFAAIAAGRRDPELAAQLLGAAQAIGPLAEDAVTVRLRSRFLEPARGLLGDERWAAAESQGSRLSFDEAIALALDSEPTVAPPASSD